MSKCGGALGFYKLPDESYLVSRTLFRWILAILATAPSGKAMSGLVNGLAARGKLLVIGLAPDPLEVNSGSLVFGMRSISGSTTGSVQDEQETVEFSLLENVEPMIEVDIDHLLPPYTPEKVQALNQWFDYKQEIA